MSQYSSSSQEWPRRNYLGHAVAAEPSYLSPIPEQEEPPFSPSPSPLPELVVEVDRKRYNRHDETEEYYIKLEIKMLKYYRKVFFGEHIDETFDYEDLIPTTETHGIDEYDVYAFVDDLEPSASGGGDDEIRTASSKDLRHIDTATFSIHEDTESTQNVGSSKSYSAEYEDDTPNSTSRNKDAASETTTESTKNSGSSRSHSADTPDSISRNRDAASESTDEREEKTDSETSKISTASRKRHIETDENDRTSSNTEGAAESDAGVANKNGNKARNKFIFSNSSHYIEAEDDSDTVILSSKSTDSSAGLANSIGKPNVSDQNRKNKKSDSLRSDSQKYAEENNQNEQVGVMTNDTTPEIMRSARAEFHKNTPEAEKDTSKSENISFHGNINRISQVQERQIDMELENCSPIFIELRQRSPVDSETTLTSPILGKRKSFTFADSFSKKKKRSNLDFTELVLSSYGGNVNTKEMGVQVNPVTKEGHTETVFNNRDREVQTSVHCKDAAVQTCEIIADASSQTEAEVNRRGVETQTDEEGPNFWFRRGVAYFYLY